MRWEYLVEEVDMVNELQCGLDDYGKKGWELVTCTFTLHGALIVMKRPWRG